MSELDVMINAYEKNYPGSISDLLDQYRATQEMQANTQEEKQTGLTGRPEGASMRFNGGMEGKTLVGTDKDLMVSQEDSAGKIIDTTRLNQGDSLQLTNFTHSVVETPVGKQFAQEGGEILPLSERLAKYKYKRKQ